VSGNLPEKISVLRLDTDWYESTKTELGSLISASQYGGILIIDDYGQWVAQEKRLSTSTLRQMRAVLPVHRSYWQDRGQAAKLN